MVKISGKRLPTIAILSLLGVGFFSYYYYSAQNGNAKRLLQSKEQLIDTIAHEPFTTSNKIKAQTNKQTPLPKEDQSTNSRQKECMTEQQMDEFYQNWFDQINSVYDSEGNLLPEYDYLTQLDTQEMSDLAEQGYAGAMVMLGERLITSKKAEELEQGRKWLYQAVANNFVSAMPALLASYLDDYDALAESGKAGDKEKALLALYEYEGLIGLAEYIAPGAMVQGQEWQVSRDMDASVQQASEQRRQELVADFKEQRMRLGLGELKIETHALGLSKDFQLCD